jgi:hypothetical protein
MNAYEVDLEPHAFSNLTLIEGMLLFVRMKSISFMFDLIFHTHRCTVTFKYNLKTNYSYIF